MRNLAFPILIFAFLSSGIFYGNLDKALRKAAAKGEIEKVQDLLTQGANPSSFSGWKGRTALIEAAIKGHSQVVGFLIENGARVDFKGNTHKTPLVFASLNGHAATVELLIENGAYANATDDLGDTALHFACWKGYLEVVKILLKHNADLNIQSSSGQTPLMLAVIHNHPEIVKILLKNNANVNLKTKLGWQTALMQASAKGNIDVVTLLLQKGADVNEIDINGKSAIQIANESGFSEIAQILNNAGSKAVAKSSKEGTFRKILKKTGENISGRTEITKMDQKTGTLFTFEDKCPNALENIGFINKKYRVTGIVPNMDLLLNNRDVTYLIDAAAKFAKNDACPKDIVILHIGVELFDQKEYTKPNNPAVVGEYWEGYSPYLTLLWHLA